MVKNDLTRQEIEVILHGKMPPVSEAAKELSYDPKAATKGTKEYKSAISKLKRQQRKDIYDHGSLAQRAIMDAERELKRIKDEPARQRRRARAVQKRKEQKHNHG